MKPDNNKNNYFFENAKSNNTYTTPVKIGLNLIFGKNKSKRNFFFHNSEYIFRFSFESKQDYAGYNNIRLTDSNYNKIKFTARLNYTYQTQALRLGYQFSSKSFLKNFAFFGGISADFGMLALKRINNFYYDNNKYNRTEVANFYSTFARANCNLGIKYNFTVAKSIFFAHADLGYIRYGDEINTNGTYGGASFGIRYKFLEDQDKLNYKNNSFW